MGVSGYGSLSFQLLVFLNYVIGTKYKVIKGWWCHKSRDGRGEVQRRGNFYSGYLGAKPHWLRDKKYNFLQLLVQSDQRERVFRDCVTS
jgi:hypothetical protein